MAQIRALHLPPELFGDNYLIPINEFPRTSLVRRFVLTAEIGAEIPLLTVVEVDDTQLPMRGNEAKAIAQQAVQAYNPTVQRVRRV